MVGGVFRLSPVAADAGAAAWQGVVAVDVKTAALDARGTLTSRSSPKGWTGTPPYVALSWRGPMAAPLRDLDAAPLTNGLAAIVLQRELERIEAFEVEANERARLNGRRAMDQAPERDRLAARGGGAAGGPAGAGRRRGRRLAREREEAERQAKLRAEQEAERVARLRAPAGSRAAGTPARARGGRAPAAGPAAGGERPSGAETPVRAPPCGRRSTSAARLDRG